MFGYVQRDLFENSRDSAARDAELGRETAGRSEPGAGAKATDRYGLPQRRRELSVDRDRRRTVDLRHPQRGSRRRRMSTARWNQVSSCHSSSAT